GFESGIDGVARPEVYQRGRAFDQQVEIDRHARDLRIGSSPADFDPALGTWEIHVDGGLPAFEMDRAHERAALGDRRCCCRYPLTVQYQTLRARSQVVQLVCAGLIQKSYKIFGHFE